MGLFAGFLGTRARGVTIVAGLLLIGYISFLVGMNYISLVRLQKSTLEQLGVDMEKRATAIGYFFAERKNDLRNLAASRTISAFFENKALGMSMEYGLRASLLSISKNFDRLLAEREFQGYKIFDRIALIDRNGKLLADSQPEGAKKGREKDWKRFLTPENPGGDIIVSHDKQSLKWTVSIPYFFKKRYAAQIVAWGSLKGVCRLVGVEGESPGRSLFISCGKELIPLHAGLPYEAALTNLPNLATLETGKTCQFSAVDKDGTRMDILAARVPIKNTPLSLVFLLPASQVFGPIAPWHLPLAMAIIAIIILGGIIIAFRINAQKLILHTRLEEISKSEEKIREKNRQLEQEIDNRKRAEEALRKAQEELEIRIKERTRELSESEAMYRTIFESTGTATVIIEEDTTISMANTEFEKLSGCSKGELEGRMSWTEFVVREDLERMKEYHIKRREGSEEPEEYEFRFIDKQGNVKNVLNKVAMIPGTRKSIASLLDITPRKKGEEALEREKEKFRVLTEKSPLGISIVQEDGRYKYINPKFIEIFGYTLEDIPTGRDWFRKAFPDKEKRKEAISTWFSDLKRLGRGEIRTRTFTTTCKDGSQKMIQFRAVTTETGDQFIIYEDITEKRRLEVQLQQAQKMEAIGTLAGGIAHDFNNLLQAISGYTEILLMSKDRGDPDYDKLVNIQASARRASELVRQILTFSRKVESKLRPVDLNQEVRQVQKLLERIIPRMIDIELHLQEGLKITNADPAQMEQVMMNLAVNARDAMPEGGRLVFETANRVLDQEYCKTHLGAVPGEYVLLSISDTGCGMDRQTLEHIFEPFYTTKGVGSGTGLGLSMVYGIVKNHGGYIMCYSEPGEGTTFKVYLPVIKQEGVEQEEKKEEKEIRGGGEVILLVDDEEDILNTGKEMLTRFGYGVITARSGEEAIEIIKETDTAPDLVILDLSMPGMGGRRCLEKLLEMDPELKIIISSGYSANGTVRATLDSGAAGFIGKPYQLKDMLKKVREVLD